MFLVNSLKSSWTAVRINSFDLLSKYADSYSLFNDSDFVNKTLLPTALDFLNDPRAMMAEASALMLKLAFIKCTATVDFSILSTSATENLLAEIPQNLLDRKLLMLKMILQLIKDRLNTFSESLITQGKTTALIHGLLSFFKHVFSDFKLGSKAEIGDAMFEKWRVFYHDILSTSL